MADRVTSSYALDFEPAEYAGSPPPSWWDSDHWATPPEFVAELAQEFGAFDLDPCALSFTAKAPRFYTPAENGLQQPWFGRVFCNPPFSAPLPWIRRALAVTEDGDVDVVVMLLPVKTDTGWFHDYVKPHAEVRFLRGRLCFYGWEGTPLTRARFPNMLAIFRGHHRG